MKKIIMLAVSLLMCCCMAMPALAEDVSPTVVPSAAPSATANPDDQITVDGSDMAGSMGDSGNTLLDAIKNVQESVTGAIDGFSNVSQFFGYTIGGAIGILPVTVTIFILLAVVCMVVVGIIRTIND